jgi:hypothetical protein
MTNTVDLACMAPVTCCTGGYSAPSGALPPGASSSSITSALPGGVPGSVLAHATYPSTAGMTAITAAAGQSSAGGAGASASRPAGDGRLVVMSTSQVGHCLVVVVVVV